MNQLEGSSRSYQLTVISYQLVSSYSVTKLENCFIENLLKIKNCKLKTANSGGVCHA